MRVPPPHTLEVNLEVALEVNPEETRYGTGSEPVREPEVALEVNPEARGMDDTPIAVTQEDCLVYL